MKENRYDHSRQGLAAGGIAETFAFAQDRYSDMLSEADENRGAACFEKPRPSVVVILSQAMEQFVARLLGEGLSSLARVRAHHPKATR